MAEKKKRKDARNIKAGIIEEAKADYRVEARNKAGKKPGAKAMINIFEDSLKLPPKERAMLADQLLSSLDQPDENIDALWRKEVEKRLLALKKGPIKTVSLKEVLSKYQK